MVQVMETIHALGHKNILATHKTTLAITKDCQLSERGNCIIAVSADKAVNNLSEQFKSAIRGKNVRVTILIDVGGIIDVVSASGNPLLILSDPTDVVVRKSDYICNRTLAVHADKAACDLSRKLVERLTNPHRKVKITLTVKPAQNSQT